MKSHGEGHYEHGDHHRRLEEGLEDVGEHDDVDAEEGQLPDVGQQVEPGRRDGEGAEDPLPVRLQPRPRAAVVKVQAEHYGRAVARQLEGVFKVEILQSCLGVRKE